MTDLEEKRQFLLDDLRQCHEQLRHIELVRVSIYKYVFAFWAVVATVCFAAFHFITADDNQVKLFIGIILLIAFAMGLWFVHTLLMKTALFQRYLLQMHDLRRMFYTDLKGKVIDHVGHQGLGVKRKIFDLRTINSRFIMMIIVVNAIIINLSALFIGAYFVESKSIMFLIGLGVLFLAGLHLFLHLRNISKL